MPQPSTHQFAVAAGTSGAYVDVSAKIVDDASISRSWGRKTQWQDTPPGTFSFTLDNRDGRFTPGNTASAIAGGLASPLVEGMGVCWQIGTRLVAGKIRSFSPQFQTMRADTAQIRITCDDMLGNAGRHKLTNLTNDVIMGASPYLYWPLNDAAGSQSAAEMSGNNQPAMAPYNEAFLSGVLQEYGVLPTFGTAAVPAVGLTQANIAVANGSPAQLFGTGPGTLANLVTNKPFATINYPTNNYGVWSVWVTPLSVTNVTFIYFGPVNYCDFAMTGGTNYTCTVNGTDIVSTVPCTPNVPHLLQATVGNSGGNRVVAFYIDGVFIGNNAAAGTFTNATAQPGSVRIATGSAFGDSAINISAIAHTPTLVDLIDAGPSTEVARLGMIASTTPEINIPSFPTDLSTAPIGIASTTGSTLDALNDLVKTEQGYIYTTTTGTLTAPVQGIVVRSRQRPAAPTTATTFGVTTDIVGSPALARDITNTVSTITVTGPSTSAVATDPTLVPLAGSSTDSENVLLLNYSDLLGWGQDRLARGKNSGMTVTSITVEAISTSIDRWADLIALNPGDRIRVSGLPVTQLGFSTFDGYLLGADEAHSQESKAFTLYLAPVVPTTAIFDTNLWMNGTNNALTVAMTTGATTLTVNSADGVTWFEQSVFPYSLIIDSEQVTVTAAAAPGATQVLTIARAQAGTTAATHAIGAVPEITPASVFAF